MRGSGFSLVELLVVVTIIVVLLALLAPAMEKAVYHAELVTCAARQDGVATGVLGYAMSYRRYYPHRAGPAEVNWVPAYVCSNDRDDRAAIFEAVSPKLLLDPFRGKIDLTATSPLRQIIYANYSMYFSWRFTPTGDNGKQKNREKGMYKLGDRFTWTDYFPQQPIQRSYNLLLSDMSVIREPDEGSTVHSAHGSHPDRDQQIMNLAWSQDDPLAATFYAGQGQVLTFSFWRIQDTTPPRPKRGLYDISHAYDDGSVVRTNDVKWDERERMTFIPEANNRPYNDVWGQQVPRP
jgi:prepilin-type N-terminal cleavage/methylation domain-containing protein